MVQEWLLSLAAAGLGFAAAGILSLFCLSPQQFAAPCPQWQNQISSAFGDRTDLLNQEQKEFHKGVDIAVQTDTPVYAVADGQEAAASQGETGYGYHLLIQHESGFESLYAHCSVLEVSKGEQVKAGQEIARSGATGEVTGPHLHLELKKDGEYVDPLLYLPEQ